MSGLMSGRDDFEILGPRKTSRKLVEKTTLIPDQGVLPQKKDFTFSLTRRRFREMRTLIKLLALRWRPISPIILTREQLPQARVALQRLTEREAELVAALQRAMAAVDEVVECEPFSVVRIDPEKRRLENVAAEIQARAEARAQEWMDALGGGTVLTSAAASSAATAADPATTCTVRRDAWVTIVRTAHRPVQVVAAMLSVLPPDGATCRLCDVSWLEPSLGDVAPPREPSLRHARAADAWLGREGLQLLRSLRPAESYRFDACAAQLAALALPVPCAVHLRAQPLMRGQALGGGLEACVHALGGELIRWAALREPLPARDGAFDALQRLRMSPPPPIAGRLEPVSAWWERCALYLCNVFCDTLDAGQSPWIARAQAALSASAERMPGAAGLGLPSLSGIGLLASIGAAATALGDEVRCMRVDRLLQYLLQAPPPAGGGAACAALLDESVRAGYAAGASLARAAHASRAPQPHVKA